MKILFAFIPFIFSLFYYRETEILFAGKMQVAIAKK
jgi:hypothetical protein